MIHYGPVALHSIYMLTTYKFIFTPASSLSSAYHASPTEKAQIELLVIPTIKWKENLEAIPDASFCIIVTSESISKSCQLYLHSILPQLIHLAHVYGSHHGPSLHYLLPR